LATVTFHVTVSGAGLKEELAAGCTTAAPGAGTASWTGLGARFAFAAKRAARVIRLAVM